MNLVLRLVVVALPVLVGACGSSDAPPGYDELASFVAKSKIGSDTDQWIEMQNLSGEWERTGLIFGYDGDREECLKAIAGLKKENFAREYRCTPAN